ncbi:MULTISPECIES: GNAT family N-acetyltransferase [Paeniglutamicibacter]|uniref:Acetyltransferase n=1 Tax=Paeniglutamicibacter sulfureus TaxID=43666 RepID=A0ABU2BLF7_9MICC|nr:MULTISPECIES: GNAT family N-acetyltransferase [Paeniglutamicibacter]MCV9994711.1 GNAT family N-acetyltransferase [Paeniglutamicibacter sp. ZC-3]MDO2935168.1 GNAT family N-acetyltransferase [Paeniglutamicibacter sulfureus]MDR7359480.1 putative acetyltransferase [Paeniglutamicibacter sulfureus]
MLEIRPFTAADAEAALDARAELDADDFDFLLGYSARRGFDSYLEQLAAHEEGLGLPPGWVRSALWGAFSEGTLVGRTCIRFELNENLLAVGGHIGYAVRPGHRRRGHATRILRLSLAQLAQHNIESALVTCRDDNTGSARTIEANGGELENVIEASDGPTRRYWVPTRATPRG